ncbi:MAG: alpha-glucosidase/alpha-galactosidase [Candidatus Promineifilaceae bacterium]|nr:alpha-glucosidase/alpha-galactosidase [Candidatus Promineifilaceae bacterium]
MPKITFIGAGSTVFAQNLIGDILSFPELAQSTISLHDINEDRLQTTEIVAQKIAQRLEVRPTIEATTDRRRALDGADYAISMIQVGGYKPATVTDFEVPKKYSLRQTIADTLGIGGIMRGLRTIPVLLDISNDMEALCPDVLHLNYANPMAINCWALSRATSINTVGLCHSVQDTIKEIALDTGVIPNDIEYLCAGINHMAFYLHLQCNGQDLYPLLLRIIEEDRVPPHNRVRYEMLKRLGYFVTESSEHFSEYTPWFIKQNRPDLIEKFNIPLDEYLARCEVQIADWEKLRKKLEDPRRKLRVRRSDEYGSLIIHSRETGIPRVIYGNVTNNGLIENLPAGCCVEVPCLVDSNGVQPTHIGKLPPQLAALIQTNINVQGLTVEAALTGKREHIYHAAMLDPHTAAELDLDEIWALVDELIAAHGDWLPEYH